MKVVKIVLGLIFVALGAVILLAMVTLFQRLLIFSSAYMDEMGGTTAEEGEVLDAESTLEPDLASFFSDSAFDGDPVEIPEPDEELITIPVEKTIEELAKENERHERAGGA